LTTVCGRSRPLAVSVCHLPLSSSYSIVSVWPGGFLLLGGRLRGRERLGMGREGFRKHGVDLTGPAAVVLDDYCPLRCMTPAGGSHGNPYR
jgi:hypothetical protein